MLDGYFLLQGLRTCGHLNFYTLMTRGGQIFPKIQELPQSSRLQKSDMKQVPYRGPTNLRCHCTRFILPGDQVP